MTESARIGVIGDVMLGRNVDRRQQSRPPEAVWGELLDRLSGLDGLLVNLECCLSTRGRRWSRTHRPFHFRADPSWAVPALEAAGVDCCALANNHVLDFEGIALEDTLAHLDEAGISHAGAGPSIEEALDPAFFSAGEHTLAVVAFTDNTPEYAADETSPGTARIEIDTESERTREYVTESISRAKSADPDLLVASLHWGPNMVTEPPAGFERFGRWLTTRGVDLVHGHSAHVFQGVEVHDGTPILYDTGDFVDDYAVDRDLRNDRSFLFECRVDAEGDLSALRLLPTEIDDCRVHRAGPEAASWARERMRELSAPYGTAFERDGDELVLPV